MSEGILFQYKIQDGRDYFIELRRSLTVDELCRYVDEDKLAMTLADLGEISL